MRKKMVCFSLLFVLLIVFSSFSSAAAVQVYIPTKIKNLGLPEMPEIPTLSVTYDSVSLGDPCPVILDPEGKIRLQFSRKMDDCSMFFNYGIQFDFNERVSAEGPYFSGNAVHIPINENGYGEVSVDFLIDPTERNLGTPRYYADVGNLSFRYDQVGNPTDIYLSNSVDYFCTGMSGAHATVHYEYVPVPSSSGITDVWFVESVTVNYPEGNFIREVEVHFLNNANGTPNQYFITYEVEEIIRKLRTIEYYGKGKKQDQIHHDPWNLGYASPRVTKKPKP